MASTPVMGHQCMVSVNGTAMSVKSCGVVKTQLHTERDGLSGSVQANSNDVRQSVYTVGGPIVLEPSPAELAALAALAISTANGDVLTAFTVVVDRDYATMTYEGCKVNSFSLRGQPGAPCELTLDVVGKTANATGTVTAPASSTPYVLDDVTLTLQSNSREISDFELTINNNLITNHFMNDTTLTHIPEGPRVVALKTSVDYHGDNSTLLNQAVAGAAGTILLNDGSTSHTFTFGNLKCAHTDPTITGKAAQVPLVLDMRAYKSGITADVAIT